MFILLLELDENYEVKEKREFTIPEHLMIHDWALTDTHYVLFGNRIKLDIHGEVTFRSTKIIIPTIKQSRLMLKRSTQGLYLQCQVCTQ